MYQFKVNMGKRLYFMMNGPICCRTLNWYQGTKGLDLLREIFQCWGYHEKGTLVHRLCEGPAIQVLRITNHDFVQRIIGRQLWDIHPPSDPWLNIKFEILKFTAQELMVLRLNSLMSA